MVKVGRITHNKLTRRQREQRTHAQAHPVAWLVREIVREIGSAEASPSAWLQELDKRANTYVRQSKDWPKCPAQLGRIFSELVPGLALLDVILLHRRSGSRGRLWRAENAQHVQERRHFEAQEQQRRQAEIARERESKALLRAAKVLAREPQKRAERKTE